MISGYLITAIILNDIRKGNFSIARFYERRARRIIPALYFVLLAVVPVAWALLTPSQLQSVSSSVVGVALFVPNVLFWRTTDYFGGRAAEMPLLHTWSLGVEEQFYLLFPWFLLLAARVGERVLLAALWLLAFASLALSEYAWRHGYGAMNFFLAPTRAWELLLGAIVAVLMARSTALPAFSPRIKQWLALGGIALIAGSIAFYSKNTPFPSWYALAPTVGSALILAFGTRGTLAGRLLSLRWLVGIGLVSYSAYLWHQPLFVFANIYHMEPLSATTDWLLVLMTLALAFVSWRFVEQPFRNPSTTTRQQVFGATVLLTVCFTAVGFAGRWGRFPVRVAVPREVQQSFARSQRREECLRASDDPDAAFCNIENGRASFAVIGDSHAYALLPGFEKAAREERRSGVFAFLPGCPPLLGVYALRSDQAGGQCHDLNARMFAYVKQHGIKAIFLVARWTFYTNGGYAGDDWSYIGRSPGAPADAQESRAAFKRGLAETLKRYARIGTRVYVVNQLPEQRRSVRRTYYRAFARGNVNAALRRSSVSRADHEALQSWVRGIFASYRPAGLQVLTLDAAFCDSEVCVVGDRQQSYYFDRTHLSIAGSQVAAAGLDRALERIPPAR